LDAFETAACYIFPKVEPVQPRFLGSRNERARIYKNIAYYEKLSKNEKVGKPQQEDKTR
jgi:hypothetical protein